MSAREQFRSDHFLIVNDQAALSLRVGTGSLLRPKRARSSRIIATWISVSLVWTFRS
jgi:hypothetical protein